MRKAAIALALSGMGLAMGAGIPPAAVASPRPVVPFRATQLNGKTVVAAALAYVGTRYVRHGDSPTTAFDDIGFVRYVYAGQGVHLPATLKLLLRSGPQVKEADLQPGDLVFFKNTVKAGLSHVGIYIGGGKFVHAEWYGFGVTVTSLRQDPRDGNYWVTHYRAATRPTVSD